MGGGILKLFDMTKPVSGKATVKIDQPVADIFIFIGNRVFENYPKWAVAVSAFTPLTRYDVFVEARTRQVRRENVESIFEVSTLAPPRKINLSVIAQLFRNTFYFYKFEVNNSMELVSCCELLEL